MNTDSLLKTFEYMSDPEIPGRDEHLKQAIESAGSVGVAFLLENLKSGQYVNDSIWLCQCLSIQESVPHMTPYLDSSDEDLRIAVALALTKLGSRKGSKKLMEMFELGEIPEHWLTAYGISLDFLSETEVST